MKECTKPNCNCIEIAEQNNGGNPVKSYPCLAQKEPGIHISTEPLWNESMKEAKEKFQLLLNSIQNHEVSDTTGSDSSNAAD